MPDVDPEMMQTKKAVMNYLWTRVAESKILNQFNNRNLGGSTENVNAQIEFEKVAKNLILPLGKAIRVKNMDDGTGPKSVQYQEQVETMKAGDEEPVKPPIFSVRVFPIQDILGRTAKHTPFIDTDGNDAEKNHQTRCKQAEEYANNKHVNSDIEHTRSGVYGKEILMITHQEFVLGGAGGKTKVFLCPNAPKPGAVFMNEFVKTDDEHQAEFDEYTFNMNRPFAAVSFFVNYLRMSKYPAVRNLQPKFGEFTEETMPEYVARIESADHKYIWLSQYTDFLRSVSPKPFKTEPTDNGMRINPVIPKNREALQAGFEWAMPYTGLTNKNVVTKQQKVGKEIKAVKYARVPLLSQDGARFNREAVALLWQMEDVLFFTETPKLLNYLLGIYEKFVLHKTRGDSNDVKVAFGRLYTRNNGRLNVDKTLLAAIPEYLDWVSKDNRDTTLANAARPFLDRTTAFTGMHYEDATEFGPSYGNLLENQSFGQHLVTVIDALLTKSDRLQEIDEFSQSESYQMRIKLIRSASMTDGLPPRGPTEEDVLPEQDPEQETNINSHTEWAREMSSNHVNTLRENAQGLLQQIEVSDAEHKENSSTDYDYADNTTEVDDVMMGRLRNMLFLEFFFMNYHGSWVGHESSTNDVTNVHEASLHKSNLQGRMQVPFGVHNPTEGIDKLPVFMELPLDVYEKLHDKILATRLQHSDLFTAPADEWVLIQVTEKTRGHSTKDVDLKLTSFGYHEVAVTNKPHQMIALEDSPP
jgi:hypothetical protein